MCAPFLAHVTPMKLILISSSKYNYSQGFKRLVLQVPAIDIYYSCALIFIRSNTLKYIVHLLSGKTSSYLIYLPAVNYVAVNFRVLCLIRSFSHSETLTGMFDTMFDAIEFCWSLLFTQSFLFSLTGRFHCGSNPHRAHCCGRRNTLQRFLDYLTQVMDHWHYISSSWLLSGILSGPLSWSVLEQVWNSP